MCKLKGSNTMRLTSLVALVLVIAGCVSGSSRTDENAVLSVGDVFEMTNKHGTLRIEAESNLKRTFTWNGASRSVFMESRTKPWQGALGLYWPGPGDHWENHDGVTRGVIVEQRRDFESSDEFRSWLEDMQDWYDARHTPDGVVGGWSINRERNQLNVEVWKITIEGEEPSALEGGSTDWLVWDNDE